MSPQRPMSFGEAINALGAENEEIKQQIKKHDDDVKGQIAQLTVIAKQALNTAAMARKELADFRKAVAAKGFAGLGETPNTWTAGREAFSPRVTARQASSGEQTLIQTPNPTMRRAAPKTERLDTTQHKSTEKDDTDLT